MISFEIIVWVNLQSNCFIKFLHRSFACINLFPASPSLCPSTIIKVFSQQSPRSIISHMPYYPLLLYFYNTYIFYETHYNLIYFWSVWLRNQGNKPLHHFGSWYFVSLVFLLLWTRSEMHYTCLNAPPMILQRKSTEFYPFCVLLSLYEYFVFHSLSLPTEYSTFLWNNYLISKTEWKASFLCHLNIVSVHVAGERVCFLLELNNSLVAIVCMFQWKLFLALLLLMPLLSSV